MYLTILDESVGCILGQYDEYGKKEQVIYYLSKIFIDCEMRYFSLECKCCALALAARRLRQYILTHTTWLISKMDPIKYIFEKSALSGELPVEYNIIYITQKAIKGGDLAHYLAYNAIADY
ncbi:hypothetical protein CR513_16771, partial [Mucuna pruriens]